MDLQSITFKLEQACAGVEHAQDLAGPLPHLLKDRGFDPLSDDVQQISAVHVLLQKLSVDIEEIVCELRKLQGSAGN